MKQYNKIWVPEKRQGMEFRDKDGDTPSIVSGPVIVLSLEELKEMWDTAKESPDYPGVFELFLKSKGITL